MLSRHLEDMSSRPTNVSWATIKEVKDKITSITNLDITAALNARINEVKGKIPYINNLVTTAALTAV